MKQHVSRSGLALILGLAVAASTALAEEPAPAPTPLEKELETVRKLISNAEMKLRRGVIGVAPAGEGQTTVRTPATMCCAENIERIDHGLEKIRAMVRELGTCFEQKWDRGGAEAVVMTTQELRAVTEGVKAFSKAMEVEDTVGALGGTKRSYLNLKRHIDALPDCKTGVPALSK